MKEQTKISSVKAKIIGVGSFLPGPKIDNKMLAEMISVSEEWIDIFVGTKTRHLATDIITGAVKYQLVDIGERAAKAALECAGIVAKDIDFVVMSTATPDHLMPATVNNIVDRLGLFGIPTYALQSGCAGALQALDVASQFILTGKHRTGLVIGADICNKFLRLDEDFSKLPSGELVNYVLFGDGAGAVVMSSDSQRQGLQIETLLNVCDGLGREPGQQISWLGKHAGNNAPLILEDYKAIQHSVPEMALQTMQQLLQLNAWNFADVAFLMPPQLSGNMTDLIMNHLQIEPERGINCVSYTGNTGNALPYLQLEKLWQMSKPGDRSIGVAIESSKWIRTGMALQHV